MTAQSKSVIKSYFETGDRPTQAQFVDLIDSYADTSAAVISMIGDVTAIINNGVATTTIASAAVTTPKIEGRAVSLAKQAFGTPGSILYYAVSGVPTELSIGVSGQVVTAIGGFPSYTSPPASGWVPIKTVTASNVTSVDFVNGSGGVVFDATYKKYIVLITSYIPATDNTTFQMLTSSNGGVSYDNGASDYNGAGLSAVNGGAISALGGDQATFPMAFSIGNATGENAFITVEMANPAASNKFMIKSFSSVSDATAGKTGMYIAFGMRNAAAAVNAIRFSSGSGNLSGIFTLFGISS